MFGESSIISPNIPLILLTKFESYGTLDNIVERRNKLEHIISVIENAIEVYKEALQEADNILDDDYDNLVVKDVIDNRRDALYYCYALIDVLHLLQGTDDQVDLDAAEYLVSICKKFRAKEASNDSNS